MCDHRPPSRRPNPSAHWPRISAPNSPICGRGLHPGQSLTTEIWLVTCGSCLHVIGKAKIHASSARSAAGTLCGDKATLEPPTDDHAMVTCAKCSKMIGRQNGADGVTHMRDRSRGKTLCGISSHSPKGGIRMTEVHRVVSCPKCIEVMTGARQQSDGQGSRALQFGFRGRVPKGWERVADYYPPGAFIPVIHLAAELGIGLPELEKGARKFNLEFELHENAPCLRLPEG